jgi:L-malate glycosyltransferase
MPARKIALVYDAIFPYVKGGGERRFYEIAKQLAAAGHDVHLYGMQFWDGPAVIVRDGLTLHGLCKARPLYLPGGRRSITQALVFGLSCLKLLRERFDVMDCCGFPYFSLFTCRLVTWLRRKPLYATWHEVWGRRYWREYLGRLGIVGYAVEWLAARLPSAIIAVSDHTADALKGTLQVKRPVYTIENGIHVAHIQTVVSPHDPVDVVYVGRLVAFKHVDLLLQAVAILTKQRPVIRCRIMGNGPERQRLEALVRELGLQKNVQFLDFHEAHDEVISVMKSGRVFVLPSTREGFGLVAIEANAAGVPVVTVEHSANAACKLITKDSGLVTSLNAEALAAGIAKVLAKKTPAKACVAAAQRFDWSQITHKLEAVLA